MAIRFQALNSTKIIKDNIEYNHQKIKLESIRGRFHIVAAQNDGPQIGKVGIDMSKLFGNFLRTQEYN